MPSADQTFRQNPVPVLRQLFRTVLPAAFSAGRKEAGSASPGDLRWVWPGELGCRKSRGAGIPHALAAAVVAMMSVTTGCDLKNRVVSKEKALTVFSIYRLG